MTTVSHAVARYLDFAQTIRQVHPDTATDYAKTLRVWFAPVALHPIERLREQDLTTLGRTYRAAHATSTYNKGVSVAKRFMAWTHDEGLTPRNLMRQWMSRAHGPYVGPWLEYSTILDLAGLTDPLSAAGGPRGPRATPATCAGSGGAGGGRAPSAGSGSSSARPRCPLRGAPLPPRRVLGLGLPLVGGPRPRPQLASRPPDRAGSHEPQSPLRTHSTTRPTATNGYTAPGPTHRNCSRTPMWADAAHRAPGGACAPHCG